MVMFMKKSINMKIDIFKIVIVFLFSFIFCFMTYTFISKKDIYQKKLEDITSNIVYGSSAPRGRIYDRNYNILVDNVSVPVIYYKKSDNIGRNDEIKLAYKVSKYIDIDYKKLTDRNLREFYLANNMSLCNSKITDEEWKLYKARKLTNSDIDNLKISRITEEELSGYSDLDKKAAYIYYLMNRGYSYDEKIIKDKNVTDSEYITFTLNQEIFEGFKTKLEWERTYPYGDTFRLMLGNISNGLYEEDSKYYLEKGYSLTDKVGISYLEKQYEDLLKGTKATYLKRSSMKLDKLTDAKRGNDIVLTIDINLQKEIEEIVKSDLLRAKQEENTKYLNKTYVIIQEPNTGEILAVTGQSLLKVGNEYKTVDVSSGIVTDPFTPGSVVKGASMLVGYNEQAIKMGEVLTDECIKIKSIPRKCSSHTYGKINDIDALAYSSNVYQFKIAIRVGKGNYTYNGPLDIDSKAFDIYRKTFGEFGLGKKTEIDLPVESLGYIGTSTKPEHLLNFAMGQYDSYTPIQLSQYINTVASDGKKYQPHFLKEIRNSSSTSDIGTLNKKIEPFLQDTVETKEEYLKRVQEGFKAVMDYGYGKGVMGRDRDASGKTGTSETFIDTDNDGKIDTATISNAFVGYSPSINPNMSIAVITPDVSHFENNSSFISYVNRRIARNVTNKYFELREKS